MYCRTGAAIADVNFWDLVWKFLDQTENCCTGGYKWVWIYENMVDMWVWWNYIAFMRIMSWPWRYPLLRIMLYSLQLVKGMLDSFKEWERYAWSMNHVECERTFWSKHSHFFRKLLGLKSRSHCFRRAGPRHRVPILANKLTPGDV